MRVLAINIVTLTNATTEAVITAAAPTLWGDEILAEFQTRLERWPTGYTLLSLTLDAEYLRYLDRVLVEMRHTDRRLLHPRTRNRVLLRSAALDVIVGTFIAQRESAPATLGHPVDPTDALSGDLGNTSTQASSGGRTRSIADAWRPLTSCFSRRTRATLMVKFDV